MSPGDFTITTTHREVLRRLDQGESLTTELAESLGDLYLHGLVDDVAVDGHPFRGPALTSLGRRVLDVGGVLTTRQERPRLVSRPMPEPWVLRVDGSYAHPASPHGLVLGSDRKQNRADADKAASRLRDLIALIDWLDHEERVRAQDGGS